MEEVSTLLFSLLLSLSFNSFFSQSSLFLFCVFLFFHLPCPLPLSSLPAPTPHIIFPLNRIYVCKAVQQLLMAINEKIYSEVFYPGGRLKHAVQKPFSFNTLQSDHDTITDWDSCVHCFDTFPPFLIEIHFCLILCIIFSPLTINYIVTFDRTL